MVEKSLVEDLQRIFKIKATFEIPSESKEQEVLFVDVKKSDHTIRDGIESARIEGVLNLFGVSEKIPIGYIAKCIARSKKEAEQFFFFDIEKNVGQMNNIVQRSTGFIFFYKGQFDPARGKLTTVNLTTEVTE